MVAYSGWILGRARQWRILTGPRAEKTGGPNNILRQTSSSHSSPLQKTHHSSPRSTAKGTQRREATVSPCNGNYHANIVMERDCACCPCRASNRSSVPRWSSRQKHTVHEYTGGCCPRLPRKLQALRTRVENVDTVGGECESY
jgi:hypothetical protein